MPKPGNWGDLAVIERGKPGKTKSISCRMCTSFSTHTNSCKKDEFVNEMESWKKCKKFYFKPKYDTARYWNQLVKERGYL